ncbi:MAG: glycosyltransferase family 8 protein [Peptoniphilaceae bacterium]|nr:glycosyltransferase family 8 protein [Peptoniphilaceae bacterium]MDY6018501.1 glycosyltransferase family 8 protein [Anaerococcus sp.]
MNILVTLDKNYLHPLKVMLASMFINNPGQVFDIYVIADGLEDEDFKNLEVFAAKKASFIHRVFFDDRVFDGAKASRYYSKAMYYRLLAAELLPKDLDRILYLDPDILVINEISELYNIDFEGNLFAAASHGDRMGVIDAVNRIRLSNFKADLYFNSGVMMMNLEKMREEIKKEDIFSYIEDNAKGLLLPDQDVLNALYGHKILEIDDSLYNFDTRNFIKDFIASKADKNMDWIIENTVFLHFCGRSKPWHRGYFGYFSALYKHYEKLISIYLA